MKILIVDNEADLRESIQYLIKQSLTVPAEIKEASSVKTGIEMINNFMPDIVFLDIELGDGTGFDLLSNIKNTNFQLVFTTAHNKYAIKAFKFSAIDYLLKPIDPYELENTLEKAIANISKNNLNLQLSIMMQQLNQKPDANKKIVLNDKQSTYFVNLADILYCEADGPYTKFYITNSQPILVSKNLKEFEEMLEPLGFLRTHHSYIVNPNKIKLYDKTDGGELILETGHKVPVSKRRKDEIMEILTHK